MHDIVSLHTQLVRPYVYRLIDVYTHTRNKYILVGLRFQYKFTSHKLKQAYKCVNSCLNRSEKLVLDLSIGTDIMPALQQVAHGTAAGHQLVINRYDLFRSQLPMNLHKVLRVRRQACSCRFTPDTKRKFLVFL